MKLKAIVPNWREDLCHDLFQLHRSHVLCDVFIDLENTTKLPVHSNVLAAGSPVFKKSFETQMKGKPTVHQMRISSEYSLEVWTSVVRFLYTGKIEVSPQQVDSLAKLASHLRIEPLVGAVARLIEGTDVKLLRTNPTSVKTKVRHSETTDANSESPINSSSVDSSSYMKTNVLKTGKKLDVQCPKCNLYFRSSSSLQQHDAARCCAKQYKGKSLCPICGIVFSSDSSLDRHLQLHSAGKIPQPSAGNLSGNICNTCSKTFKSKSALDRHKRTHTSESSFFCDQCGMGFKYQSSLIAHQKRQVCKTPGDKEKRFKCPYCDNKYVERKNLTAHVKVSHLGRVEFECSVCQKKCGRKDNLETHMRKHAKENIQRKTLGSKLTVNAKNNTKILMRSDGILEESVGTLEKNGVTLIVNNISAAGTVSNSDGMVGNTSELCSNVYRTISNTGRTVSNTSDMFSKSGVSIGDQRRSDSNSKGRVSNDGGTFCNSGRSSIDIGGIISRTVESVSKTGRNIGSFSNKITNTTDTGNAGDITPSKDFSNAHFITSQRSFPSEDHITDGMLSNNDETRGNTGTPGIEETFNKSGGTFSKSGEAISNNCNEMDNTTCRVFSIQSIKVGTSCRSGVSQNIPGHFLRHLQCGEDHDKPQGNPENEQITGNLQKSQGQMEKVCEEMQWDSCHQQSDLDARSTQGHMAVSCATQMSQFQGHTEGITQSVQALMPFAEGHQHDSIPEYRQCQEQEGDDLLVQESSILQCPEAKNFDPHWAEGRENTFGKPTKNKGAGNDPDVQQSDIERLNRSYATDQSLELSMLNAPEINSDDSYMVNKLDYSLLNFSR